MSNIPEDAGEWSHVKGLIDNQKAVEAAPAEKVESPHRKGWFTAASGNEQKEQAGFSKVLSKRREVTERPVVVENRALAPNSPIRRRTRRVKPEPNEPTVEEDKENEAKEDAVTMAPSDSILGEAIQLQPSMMSSTLDAPVQRDGEPRSRYAPSEVDSETATSIYTVPSIAHKLEPSFMIQLKPPKEIEDQIPELRERATSKLSGRSRGTDSVRRRIGRPTMVMGDINTIKTLSRSYVVVSMMGRPCSGKTTMAKRLVQDFSFVHYQIDAVMQSLMRSGSEEGKAMMRALATGRPVPANLMARVLDDVIRKSGHDKIVLEGFPASIEQYEHFEDLLGIDIAFLIDVPERLCQERAMAKDPYFTIDEWNELLNSDEKTRDVQNHMDEIGKLAIINNARSADEAYSRIFKDIRRRASALLEQKMRFDIKKEDNDEPFRFNYAVNFQVDTHNKGVAVFLPDSDETDMVEPRAALFEDTVPPSSPRPRAKDQHRKENRAAIEIQRIYRGYRVRIEVGKLFGSKPMTLKSRPGDGKRLARIQAEERDQIIEETLNDLISLSLNMPIDQKPASRRKSTVASNLTDDKGSADEIIEDPVEAELRARREQRNEETMNDVMGKVVEKLEDNILDSVIDREAEQESIRLNLDSQQDSKEFTEAVIRIQRWYRGVIGHRLVKRFAGAYTQMLRNIIKIQAWYRMLGPWREHKRHLLGKQAAKIQAAERGRQERKRQAKRKMAATRLIAWWKREGARLARKRQIALNEKRFLLACMIYIMWKRFKRRQEARLAELRKNAATQIQKVHRGHMGRKIAKKHSSSIVLIQREFKKFLRRKQYRAHEAAREIQRVYRGHMGRKKAIKLRRDRAATKIQSVIRMFIHRMRYIKYRAATRIQGLYYILKAKQTVLPLRQDRAARRIQRTWAMHVAKRPAREEKRRVCALKIQRVYRGHGGRVHTRRIRAIVALQCFFRRIIGCRQVIEKRRHVNAIKIQRAWRGYSDRKMVRNIRLNRAATVIQAFYRAFEGRWDVRVLRHTIFIQAFVRGCFGRVLWKKTLEAKYYHAALQIQRMTRGRIIGKRLLVEKKSEKAALEIQRKFRGYKARVLVWRTRAAIKIQSSFRQYLGVLEYREAYLAFINRQASKIQDAYRIYRSKLLMKSLARFAINLREIMQLVYHEEAINIQRVMYRGTKGRDLAWEKEQQRAALRIQAAYRSYRNRFATTAERAATFIAAFYRGHLARKYVVNLRTTAKAIKRAWFAVIDLSALTIQCIFRGYLGRMRARKQKIQRLGHCALIFQKHWRGRKGRIQANEIKRNLTAIKVQRIFRGWQARRRFREHMAQIVAEDMKEAYDNYLKNKVDRIYRGKKGSKFMKHSRSAVGEYNSNVFSKGAINKAMRLQKKSAGHTMTTFSESSRANVGKQKPIWVDYWGGTGVSMGIPAESAAGPVGPEVYEMSGGFKSYLAVLERMIRLRVDTMGPYHPTVLSAQEHYLIVLNTNALRYLEGNHTTQAHDLVKKIEKYTDKSHPMSTHNRLLVWASISNVAYYYFIRGRLSITSQFLQKSMNLARDCVESRIPLVVSLLNTAVVSGCGSHHVKAAEQVQKAIRILDTAIQCTSTADSTNKWELEQHEALAHNCDPLLACAHHNLAVEQISCGKYPDAAMNSERALALAETFLGTPSMPEGWFKRFRKTAAAAARMCMTNAELKGLQSYIHGRLPPPTSMTSMGSLYTDIPPMDYTQYLMGARQIDDTSMSLVDPHPPPSAPSGTPSFRAMKTSQQGRPIGNEGIDHDGIIDPVQEKDVDGQDSKTGEESEQGVDITAVTDVPSDEKEAEKKSISFVDKATKSRKTTEASMGDNAFDEDEDDDEDEDEDDDEDEDEDEDDDDEANEDDITETEMEPPTRTQTQTNDDNIEKARNETTFRELILKKREEIHQTTNRDDIGFMNYPLDAKTIAETIEVIQLGKMDPSEPQHYLPSRYVYDPAIKEFKSEPEERPLHISEETLKNREHWKETVKIHRYRIPDAPDIDELIMNPNMSEDSSSVITGSSDDTTSESDIGAMPGEKPRYPFPPNSNPYKVKGSRTLTVRRTDSTRSVGGRSVRSQASRVDTPKSYLSSPTKQGSFTGGTPRPQGSQLSVAAEEVEDPPHTAPPQLEVQHAIVLDSRTKRLLPYIGAFQSTRNPFDDTGTATLSRVRKEYHGYDVVSKPWIVPKKHMEKLKSHYPPSKPRLVKVYTPRTARNSEVASGGAPSAWK